MAFFSRILHFKAEEAKPSDKRAARRYPVGDKFPVKVTLSLIGRDEDGTLLGDSLTHARPWGGRLINLSESGASIGISRSAIAVRGDLSVVQFRLGEEVLDVPCHLAHFRCYPQYANCGVAFAFNDAAQQSALRQLLEPVAIGAALAADDPDALPRDAAGLLRESYSGIKATRLTVSREPSTRAIVGFNFRMNDYGVRWQGGMTELETYACIGEAQDRARSNPPVTIALTEPQQIEIRWLFCLAVPNLAKAVRADVREFLAQLVSY